MLPASPQLAALPTEVSEPPFAVQFPATDVPETGGSVIGTSPTRTRPPPTIQSTGV